MADSSIGADSAQSNKNDRLSNDIISRLDDLLDEARDLVLAIQFAAKSMENAGGYAVGAVAECALERLRDALEILPMPVKAEAGQ